MSKHQRNWEFNSPATNFSVVSAILLGSVIGGLWVAAGIGDILFLFLCIGLGLGIAMVYLLFDLANSVKEVAYTT